jgi:ATP-dependent exoDNAse (exonuclease V) alpha subunit
MDSIAIYNTNDEILQYNIKKLKELQNPILRINAKNIGINAINGNLEDTKNLENIIYLAHNAKVILLHNLCTKYGLVNGAVGYIKDFIFIEENKPPNLPDYIVIYIPSYTGPNFFPNNDIEKLKWVILTPQTAQWTGSNRGCSRTQYPLRLAYAWTPWKAQGSTFAQPVTIHLGKNEQHGVTYTCFTRVTKVEDILLPDGIGKDRLCEKIKNLKTLQNRIKEEKKLLDLHNCTITNYELDYL